MGVKLDVVKAREALKPRRDPYWHKLAKGRFLGFRKMTRDSKGAWLARFRLEDTGKQAHRPLGDFSTLPPGEQFDQAKAVADAWFRHLAKGGSTDVTTVRQACEVYVERLREGGRPDAADDAEARFRRHVYSKDVFADRDLAKLKRSAVEDWRRALKKTPVTVGRSKDATKKPETRARSDSALNRDMAALRAALNLALEDGRVTSSFAWDKPLKPVRGADKRRNASLTKAQRAALVANASGAFANFLRAMCALPIRPGALAALRVRDYDARGKALVIGKDKAGADRRVPLPAAIATFFQAMTKGKLPNAPLIANDTGGSWTRYQWRAPIKQVAAAAGLPEETIMYAVRHGAITDLVHDGLDSMTVAALAGTSVEMIERHYFHLSADRSRRALAKLEVR